MTQGDTQTHLETILYSDPNNESLQEYLKFQYFLGS